MLFEVLLSSGEYIVVPYLRVSCHARSDDFFFLITHSVDDFFSLDRQVESRFIRRASQDPVCIWMILEVLLRAVAVEEYLLIRNILWNFVLRSDYNG